MLKPVAPDPGICAWLWSEEGWVWHQKNIQRLRFANGVFAEVKNDHECDSCSSYCGPAAEGSPYVDCVIISDIKKYGISGVPAEWKEHARGGTTAA
jgi:hypothetical protein